MSNPNSYDASYGTPDQAYQQVPAGDPNVAGNQPSADQFAQPYQQNIAGQPGTLSYGQPDPAAGTWSKMSIAGFVVGIIVLIVSFASGYAIAAVLPLALGVTGLRDIKQHGKKGKGLAIAGIVLGGISMVYYLFALIIG